MTNKTLKPIEKMIPFWNTNVRKVKGYVLAFYTWDEYYNSYSDVAGYLLQAFETQEEAEDYLKVEDNWRKLERESGYDIDFVKDDFALALVKETIYVVPGEWYYSDILECWFGNTDFGFDGGLESKDSDIFAHDGKTYITPIVTTNLDDRIYNAEDGTWSTDFSDHTKRRKPLRFCKGAE